MTLIVARKVDTISAAIVGDSLISSGAEDLRRRQLGLKIISFNRSIMVAFAGSPHIALDAIAQARETSVEWTAEDLAARLVHAAGADFILLDDGRIHAIRDGAVDLDLHNAWIGDHSAFNAFQRHHASICQERGQIGDNLMDALETLAGVESVGGPIVSARSRKGYTSYDGIVKLRPPPYRPQPGIWSDVDLGDAARGGYAYTTITPPEPGIAGWGVFWFQAFRGLYFAADFPKRKYEVLRAVARTAEEFCASVAPDVGYLPQFFGQIG